MTGPRVLVVTTVHVADDARIAHRELVSLVAAGARVTYAAPHRASGGAGPTARSAAAPVALPAALAGIATVDLPRAVGRRRLAALLAARRTIARLGPEHDLLLVHDPELLLAVRAVRRHRRPPLVLDVHEDLVASLADRAWLPRPLRGPAVRAARRLERWAEANAHLVLAEEGYRTRFVFDHPVVPNRPPRPTRRPGPAAGAATAAAAAPARVVHVGRLSRGRGALELLELGRRLATEGVVLELAGDPDDDVRAALDAAVAAGAVRWHGRVPNDRVGELLDGALAGLSLLHDLPNYRLSLPTKVVEYVVHGVPAIATPLPEVVRLAERTGAIVTVPFGDVEAVLTAVRRLRDEPSTRAGLVAAALGAADGLVWEPEGERFTALMAAWARGPRPALAPLAPDAARVVIVPASGAADDLPGCLAAVLPQLAPGDEVVVAAADEASAAAARAVGDARIRVVDNPRGTTPAALNRAIAASRAEVIVRVDAQSRVPPDHLDRVRALLVDTGAANVGGRQVPAAERGFGAAVARAMASPAGSGGAAYRRGGSPRAVDTVYLGAYRRSALAAVGGFDERFLRTQDAETNVRLRRAGYRVWLDPTLEVRYAPRRDPAALWRQYRGYGAGRRMVGRLHPGSLAPRQLAAPLLVAAAVAAGAAAVALSVAGVARPGPLVPLALVGGGYGALVAVAAVAAARDRPSAAPAVALALATMHLAWGVGFWLGPPRDR